MSQVTAPSVSANKMIFCAFVDVNLCNYTLLLKYILSVRAVGQLWKKLAHNGLPLVVCVCVCVCVFSG